MAFQDARLGWFKEIGTELWRKFIEDPEVKKEEEEREQEEKEAAEE